ncbi:uncharacterized protein LOC103313719 [Tribolium castaneum]|uniref:Uncharacterized protein n=1 Tax=Tribolium castaneum TaxID=7070 RepID=A0A139WET8_TRICA|nr:PREDICTED: uncharacterized protein LOC103313719 [Tribolium castaneum]KYB26375.1 hypothetical protein TcasGA2_TC033801 [Tribolium castaneum]|eukprot:XP_008195968.1 PREDICTED: uncharacterized protein LOC103313719 [Tribolium castaneum]
MPDTEDKPFGFGSAVKRFRPLGLHPELITVNTTNPLGPGQYDPKPACCKYKNNAASWKVKLDSEEFSKYLGFRNPQVLCDRMFERTLGGPGTYELFDYKEKGVSTLENVGFGSGERFHSAIRDETLPPGCHTLKTLTTKFTKTPTFEFDGITSRFKNTEPPYRKAPNRYKLPTYCITNKVVSKRGPYDTFTGPRDETTIKNHFAPPLFKSPDTFYAIPSAVDHLLYHPSKKRNGKFLLEERFPEGLSVTATKNGFSMFMRDPEYPSPAQYEVSQGIKAAKKSLHPFNSSNVNARPPANWKIHPGPDRYKVKYPTCHQKSVKGSWMFLSTTERELVKVESYSNFIY